MNIAGMNINSDQLTNELKSADPTIAGIVIRNQILTCVDIEGNEKDIPAADINVVKNHVPQPTPENNAAQTLLTDSAYDLKSRQAFAIILNILPGDKRYPTS